MESRMTANVENDKEVLPSRLGDASTSCQQNLGQAAENTKKAKFDESLKDSADIAPNGGEYIIKKQTSAMQLSLCELTSISPIDGRYSDKVTELRDFFSEFALIRNRTIVEVKWLVFLAQQEVISEVKLSQSTCDFLETIFKEFSIEDAQRVKQIEATTRHDVKAVEYFLKERFSHHDELKTVLEFLHFACTSEDINNLSWALSLQESRDLVMLPLMQKLIKQIGSLAKELKDIPMMARTHGQPATPTTIGKEFANVAVRLKRQYDCVRNVSILGKMNGAVGNYNAHSIAYPDVDWLQLGPTFVTSLGLEPNPFTTQVEPHDYNAELFHAYQRFNTIVMDFNRDMWTYISLGYFLQRKLPGEVGSSTMPHKVNPIDFENSEGNLGISNALLGFFASKLPISRMQRDLTDSTVQRNMGTALANAMIAFHSTLRGLNKIDVNKDVVFAELNSHWELLAEPIQTVMRKRGIEHAYEKLKEHTQVVIALILNPF